MHFMVLLKSSEHAPSGVKTGHDLPAEMDGYNEQLVNSGVLLAGENLQPSSLSSHVDFAGAKPTVADGPFATANQLIAGFWIIQGESLDDAIEWVRRCPVQGASFEIRQIFGPAERATAKQAASRGRDESVSAPV